MCFFSLTFLHLRCVYTHSCLFLYLGHFCFSYYFTSISVIPLLLPLSRFSRVWLCGTPQTAVHQAPPSLGFSRQEHWSGLPFPSPMHESEKWKWSHSVVSDSGTLWTAAYQAPPSMGFSMARLLEWGAIAFSPVIPLIHPFSRWSSQSRDRTRVSCICRHILYQLSHKGSPRMLEWVAYPFSSGSSWPRNRTRVSCVVGRFFTNWAMRKAVLVMSFTLKQYCICI